MKRSRYLKRLTRGDVSGHPPTTTRKAGGRRNPYQGEFALENEASIDESPAFLSTVARLWHIAAHGRGERQPQLAAWRGARAIIDNCLSCWMPLCLSVPQASGTFDSLVDRPRRGLKTSAESNDRHDARYLRDVHARGDSSRFRSPPGTC